MKRRMDIGDRREHLGRFSLFADLNSEDLAAVAEETRPVYLSGGEYLFRQEDDADGLYLLVHGRLRVWVQDEGNESRVVGEVNPGETIGEMALIAGGTRSASARAIRDSELLELPKDAFDRLMPRHPEAILQLSRLIVRRHQSNLQSRTIRPQVKTLAVFPGCPGTDPADFCEALARGLGTLGKVEVVRPPAGGLDPAGQPELLEHIHELESRAEFLLFQCSPVEEPWNRFALTQADRILILCPAGGDVTRIGRRSAELEGTLARREVILEHSAAFQPSGSSAWCRAFGTLDRHHVVRGDWRSMERTARLVTGRGVGLVLGGGGARAFCHVGLLKALEKHGVPIDHVGGTSMGGILAAQIASGKRADELREWILELRRDGLLKNDYTLPLYSVVTGRNFARIFEGWGGDQEMEDLRLDCFCVSANLTKARQEVHRSGKVRHVCRATSALPGVLPPVHLGGDLLVDGGVLNNVPIDVMVGMERGSVIASRTFPRTAAGASLGPDEIVSGWGLLCRRLLPFLTSPEIPSIAEIIVRAGFLSSTVNQDRTWDLANFRIDFEFPQFGLLDWQNAERIMDESAEIAAREVEGWQQSHPDLLGDGPNRIADQAPAR